MLTLHRGGERFDDLGGLGALKSFTKKALTSSRRSKEVRPRGILLLSVPGIGKSEFAKALGNETVRPTLAMDVCTLMGRLVGKTEANIRQALRIVDTMYPAILFIDEIEKAQAGAQSSDQTDSGVGARLFGTFLTWLSDHVSDVFVVATSNDVSKLPHEFSRAERWDGTFFLDMPGQLERSAIWDMYINRFGLDPIKPGRSTRAGRGPKSDQRAASQPSWMFLSSRRAATSYPSPSRLLSRWNGCETGPACAAFRRILRAFAPATRAVYCLPATRNTLTPR